MPGPVPRKGRRGLGGQRRRRRSARTYWSIGGEPTISPPRLSPTALLMYLPTNPVNTELALGLKKTLPWTILAANVAAQLKRGVEFSHSLTFCLQPSWMDQTEPSRQNKQHRRLSQLLPDLPGLPIEASVFRSNLTKKKKT